MVSYRMAIFGLGLIFVGVLLIVFNVFVADVIALSDSVTTSAESATANDIYQSIMDGLAFLFMMLGGVFLVAGALEDRARNVR
jgi:uncharacterized protein YqhQ